MSVVLCTLCVCVACLWITVTTPCSGHVSGRDVQVAGASVEYANISGQKTTVTKPTFTDVCCCLIINAALSFGPHDHANEVCAIADRCFCVDDTSDATDLQAL